MKNVHALAKDLLERLPKLNFLVHSAGVFGIYGFEETEEGIDKKLASRYYSRWALTHDLLPLLLKAKDIVGEPASVLSILGAGWAPQVDLDNLGLKKSYPGIQAVIQSISYNDLMVAVSRPYIPSSSQHQPNPYIFFRNSPAANLISHSPTSILGTSTPGCSNPPTHFINSSSSGDRLSGSWPPLQKPAQSICSLPYLMRIKGCIGATTRGMRLG